MAAADALGEAQRAASCWSTPTPTRSTRPAATCAPARPRAWQADLATDEGVAAVRAALGDARDGVVTCFEVIEHLATFDPLSAR